MNPVLWWDADDLPARSAGDLNPGAWEEQYISFCFWFAFTGPNHQAGFSPWLLARFPVTLHSTWSGSLVRLVEWLSNCEWMSHLNYARWSRLLVLKKMTAAFSDQVQSVIELSLAIARLDDLPTEPPFCFFVTALERLCLHRHSDRKILRQTGRLSLNWHPFNVFRQANYRTNCTWKLLHPPPPLGQRTMHVHDSLNMGFAFSWRLDCTEGMWYACCDCSDGNQPVIRNSQSTGITGRTFSPFGRTFMFTDWKNVHLEKCHKHLSQI